MKSPDKIKSQKVRLEKVKDLLLIVALYVTIVSAFMISDEAHLYRYKDGDNTANQGDRGTYK